MNFLGPLKVPLDILAGLNQLGHSGAFLLPGSDPLFSSVRCSPLVIVTVDYFRFTETLFASPFRFHIHVSALIQSIPPLASMAPTSR